MILIHRNKKDSRDVSFNSKKRIAEYLLYLKCYLFRLISFSFLLIFLSASASGQIVRFVVNGLPGGSGNYGPSPLLPSLSNANVTIAGLTRGSGVGTSGSAASNAWGGTSFILADKATAISSNTFATFSITANAGYKLSLTNIPVYNIRRSNSGPPNGIWQYQVGAGAFTDIGSIIGWGSGSSSGNDQPSISLSGIPALQNVPAGTTVTFRIVSWGGSNSSGTWYFYDPSNNRPLEVNGNAEAICAVTGTYSSTAVCSGNSNGSTTITLTGNGTGVPGIFTVDGGAPQAYTTNPFTVNGLSGGNHTIVATETSGGCVSAPIIINIPVNPLPVVSISGLSSQYCYTASQVTLTGSPAGGTFSGPGISGNTFDPKLAGTGGPYNISYEYTDTETGCSNISTQQVTVNAIPTVTISSTADTICAGSIANLTLNFTGTGPWKYEINGLNKTETSNNPEIIPVNPFSTTTYQITSLSDVNCVSNNWLDISTGGYHSLAIKAGGTLWSWGSNNDGQLGIGNTTDTNNTVQIGTETNWNKIATTANSSYAIKNDGTLWAWGENFYGQLGIGSNVNTNIPVQVGTANDWMEIAGGNLHALAIKYNGTLWAWGRNISGQLGDGTAIDKNSPVQIGTDNDWTEISAGTSHSLGRKTNGKISSWGSNIYGQTGTGSASNVPVQLSGNNWSSISAGAEYSMAVKTNGTLFTWGRNNLGQLGINSYTDINTPTQEFTSANNWSKISASSAHSLAIKTNGALWSWGLNQFGQLGNGTLTSSNIPVQMGNVLIWSKISSGLDNSTAIKSNGTMWAWGRNNNGQLGDGSYINKSFPVQMGIAFDSVTITTISLPTVSFTGLSTLYCAGASAVTLTGNPAGGIFSGPGIIGNTFDPVLATAGGPYTITYTITDGITGCSNSAVQNVSVSEPAVSFSGLDLQYCANESTVILTGSPVGGVFSGPGINGNIFDPKLAGVGGPYIITYSYLDIATGCSSTYSLPVSILAVPTVSITASPAAICTGNTSNISLNFTSTGPWTYSINGNIPVTTSNNPELIPVNPAVTTTYSITSLSNTTCIANGWVSLSAQFPDSHGIKGDGTMWAWGRNDYSQYGNATYVSKKVPIQIGTDSNWTQISTGILYTLAIKRDGTLWGWGANGHGQLGDGSYIQKSTPVQIGTDSDWARVNACIAHNLAIKNNGTLWAWGLNDNGQVGNGSYLDRNTPVQIGTDSDWIGITGGNNHSLAIKSNGTLWGWGNGGSGNVLLGIGTSSNIPVQRGTATDWSKISGDVNHTLGIKSNGTLLAWGINLYGQLGNGTFTDSSFTTVGTNTWADIFATTNHSLGIRQDGTLWTWGLNEDGQLGDGTTLTRSLPVQIGSDNDWAKLSGGINYSMAIKANGTLWSWGDNFFGQLGAGSNTDINSPVHIIQVIDSVIVTVSNVLPSVSFTGLLQLYCTNQGPVTLTGNPAGGIFSGPGISGNIFNPATAGAGTHSITYSYTNVNGCSNSSTQSVIVNELPIVSFSGLPSVYCANDPALTLTGSPAGGTFSGPGITGNTFNPAVAGTGGLYIITYTYTDPVTGCSNTSANSITLSCAEALVFDGVNDNVALPNSLAVTATDPTNTAITIEYWFKGSNVHSAVRLQDDNGYIVAGWSSLGQPIHIISTDNGINGIGINPIVNNGNWHHVAMTWEKNTINGFKSYVDGQLYTQRNSANANLPLISSGANLGSYRSVGEFMNGQLDEVRIWNRALCQEEIQSRMNCEIPGAEAGLLANYHFNHGVAGSINAGINSLSDASTNNYNGTLNNFALSGTVSNWVAPGAVVSGVSCSGIIAAQEINVQGNGLTIADNNTFINIIDYTDFGTVIAGGTRTRTFIIQNTGTASLAISGITMAGINQSMFTVGSLTPASPIAAGNSAAFTVTFSATSTGVKTATVVIGNNDCNESVYDFAVEALSECPAVSFTGLAVTYCSNAPSVTLTGNPTGGTFSGPGITGNVFDPATAGVGTHNIQYTYSDGNGCSNNETQQVTVSICTPAFVTLNLTAFLEGFYYDINTMRANIFELGISTDPGETDTVTVNLWAATSLGNTEPDHTVKAVLHTDGTATMQFPSTLMGNEFYIAVKHRNHMETWSKLPVTFSSITEYDFTDNLLKAYDDGVNPPMTAVAGSKFAFYGGDVNQDGTVDGSDANDIEIGANNFDYGYNSADANGDGETGGQDANIVEINANLFLFYARPY